MCHLRHRPVKQMIKDGSNRNHLDHKTVREWVRDKTILMQERFLQTRCKNKKSESSFHKLLTWISEKRDGGICVNGPMISRDKKRNVINFNSKLRKKITPCGISQ